MTKNIMIIAILLIIIVFIYNKNKGIKCYELPLNKDPKIFGPLYWKALHDIAGRIPCNHCKTFTEHFMIFFHDVVNKKLGKPLFDPENYNKVLTVINS